MFITAFTSARQLFPSWTTQIQFITLSNFPGIFIIIRYSHLKRRSSKWSLSISLPTKPLYVPLLSHMSRSTSSEQYLVQRSADHKAPRHILFSNSCYFIPRSNVSNPALYKLFVLLAPSLLSLFHCLLRNRGAVQVSSTLKFSIKT